MAKYLDREGKWVSEEEHQPLVRDKHYPLVRKSVENGHIISTVWLSWTEDPEELFETMIFKEGRFIDVYSMNYKTEKEAIEGHNDARKWLKHHLEEQNGRN